MGLLRSKNTAIGLDIGSKSFRVVKIKKGRNKPKLTTVGSINIPRGAVSGGEITDVEVVAESLTELWKRAGIKDKEVVMGIANQRVVVRLVDFPYLSTDELKTAIQFQAQDFIPIPVEDAIIDYQIIGEYYSKEGDRMLQLLLVAAQKGMINTFIEAAEKAGLKPVVIDVNSFAISRALLYSQNGTENQNKSMSEVKSKEKIMEKDKESTTKTKAGETVLEDEQISDEEVDNAEDKKQAEIKNQADEPEEKFDEIKAEKEINDDTGKQNEEESKKEQLKDETVEEEIETINETFFEENMESQEQGEVLEEEDEDEGPPVLNDGGQETNVKDHETELTKEYEKEDKDVTAVIDVGAEITNLVIMENSQIKFVRVIGVGGNDWTETIIDLLGVPYDEAEEYKLRIGLPPLSGDKYVDVPGEMVDKADRVFNALEREIIRFMGEIKRSFEYYISQTGGSTVNNVILTGGASSLKNFKKYVERGLDSKIELRSPFNAVEVSPKIKEQIPAEEEGSYAIAIGLALRGLE